MKELQKKQRTRKLLYSLPSLILLLLLAIFLVKGMVGVINKERLSSARTKDLEIRFEELISRENELQGEISRLQTEEGIMDEIKEKFSVTQEGEYVAVIVDERSSASSTDEGGSGWYKKLWSFLTSFTKD